MRYKLLVLLLLAGLTACSFHAQVLTPESIIPMTETEMPSAIPSPVLTNTSTPNPSPADLNVPPTLTSTPLPPISGVYPIRFAPNGTYVDVVDSLQAGTSKTYSVDALKGQVMSISINQRPEGDWVYIPIQITGADGTVLCPPTINTECTFWRGILPATQNYFVKLTPVNDVMNFTLRVAVDPPGTTTQEFQYVSADPSAAFSYTDEFAPTRFPGPQLYKMEPDIALGLVDSQFYLNTNLSEAYLLFGSTNESDTVQNCTQPASFGGEERIVGQVNINGVPFVRSEGAGVGAGNIYEQIYHRTVLNGYCYEVTFFFHYTNIGNYSPDSGVKEFDRSALMQKFEGILSTLVIR